MLSKLTEGRCRHIYLQVSESKGDESKGGGFIYRAKVADLFLNRTVTFYPLFRPHYFPNVDPRSAYKQIVTTNKTGAIKAPVFIHSSACGHDLQGEWGFV
jgi:hypothetical protein